MRGVQSMGVWRKVLKARPLLNTKWAVIIERYLVRHKVLGILKLFLITECLAVSCRTLTTPKFTNYGWKMFWFPDNYFDMLGFYLAKLFCLVPWHIHSLLPLHPPRFGDFPAFGMRYSEVTDSKTTKGTLGPIQKCI